MCPTEHGSLKITNKILDICLGSFIWTVILKNVYACFYQRAQAQNFSFFDFHVLWDTLMSSFQLFIVTTLRFTKQYNGSWCCKSWLIKTLVSIDGWIVKNNRYHALVSNMFSSCLLHKGITKVCMKGTRFIQSSIYALKLVSLFFTNLTKLISTMKWWTLFIFTFL